MSSFLRRLERQLVPSRKVHPITDLDGKLLGYESNPCRSGEVREHLNRPCHNSINGNDFLDVQCVATDMAVDRKQKWYDTFNASNSQQYPKDWSLDWSTVEPFLKWFLYESFASPFIINKDDMEFVKNYGIIVTAHMPAALLQNIMIASRYPLECSAYSFDMFNAMTAKGVDPNVAYVTALCASGSKNTFHTDPDKALVSYPGSHRTSYGLSIAGMKAMIRGELTGPLSIEHNYTVNKYYRGGSGFFENGDFILELILSNRNVRNALSEYRKTKATTEVYTPPNPFAPRSLSSPSLPPDKYTYTEMYECLIPFITTSQLLKE